MKEATGELNMTVVTIAAVAALLAFFYLIIWPTIQSGMIINSACNASDAGQQTYSQTYDDGSKMSCSLGKCTYTTAKGKKTTQTCKQ